MCIINDNFCSACVGSNLWKDKKIFSCRHMFCLNCKQKLPIKEVQITCSLCKKIIESSERELSIIFY